MDEKGTRRTRRYRPEELGNQESTPILLLTQTTDKLQLVTDAAATVDVHASFVDMTQADPPAVKGSTSGRQHTAITTATTTDIVAAPAASTTRNVKTLHIRNKHATLAVIVTVVYDQNATDFELHKVTLLAGEALEYVEGIGFFLLASTASAKDPLAKCWGIASGDGLTLLDSFNITSITDTGAGLLTFTIATDFASASWVCQVSIRRTSTALTVTNLKYAAVRNAGQAAGSVLVECWDGTATTAVQEDPDAYFMTGYGDQ